MAQPEQNISSKNLFNPQFLLLWQGQFISKLGTCLFDLALILWLKEVTESAASIALILIGSNIPEIVLAPLGGTLADTFSRRKILIVADLISGLLVLGFGLVLIFNILPNPYLFALLFLTSTGLGIGAAAFNPAVNALLPDLTAPEKLHSANSLFQSTGKIAEITGQGLGGILFMLLGAPILFLANGISFIFSASSEFFIKSDPIWWVWCTFRISACSF